MSLSNGADIYKLGVIKPHIEILCLFKSYGLFYYICTYK